MTAEIIPLFSIATIARSPRLQSEMDKVMALLSDASEYLDGHGRSDCRALTGEASMRYAHTSVRLTFLLSHLASWTFVQRSAIEGVISPDEAAANSRACFATLPRQPIADDACLPEPMRDLIRRSQISRTTLVLLHERMYEPAAAVA